MNSDDIFRYLIEAPWIVFVVVLGRHRIEDARDGAAGIGCFPVRRIGPRDRRLLYCCSTRNASIGVLALHIFPRTMVGAVVGN